MPYRAGPSSGTHRAVPELPEVEVTRRGLVHAWVGSTIEKVWTTKPNYFFATSPDILKRRLRGRCTTRLIRHGKYIVAELDDGARLLCHLGMTGQITARPLAPDPHVHLKLSVSQSATITFRDVRKFGKVEYLPPGQSSARLDRLGPDALSIDADALGRSLARRSVPIKTALLDQSVLAGVGNIYADEALFDARVRPSRPANRLGSRTITRLLSSVQTVLLASIEGGGSTVNDYLKPDGTLGGYQDWHRVYGKRGQPCPRCSTPLSHSTHAGRSTHFCKKCQR